MKNRAKCRLCLSVLESLSENDTVECECGEISISGGETRYLCAFKDVDNFLRLDDENKEIQVKFKEESEEKAEVKPPLTRSELLDMLSEMNKSSENLPQHAMLNPVTHYDLSSALILLESILRSS